jgi:hypothetical protein
MPRLGRILMATGRDAADVALTTSFGQADLRYFFVVTEEEIPPTVEEPVLENNFGLGLPYFESPPGA